jgi:hypothetical protein
VSRRDILKGGLAAGMGAHLIGSAGIVRAATPKSGGTLRIGTLQDVKSLNPLNQAGYPDVMVFPIAEGLVRIGAGRTVALPSMFASMVPNLGYTEHDTLAWATSSAIESSSSADEDEREPLHPCPSFAGLSHGRGAQLLPGRRCCLIAPTSMQPTASTNFEAQPSTHSLVSMCRIPNPAPSTSSTLVPTGLSVGSRQAACPSTSFLPTT